MRYLEAGFAVVYLGLLIAILMSLGVRVLVCSAVAPACQNGISLSANAGTYAGSAVAVAGGVLICLGLLQKPVRDRWLNSFQGSVVVGFILAYLGLVSALVASYGGPVVIDGRAGTWLTVTLGTYAGSAVSAAGLGVAAAGLLRGRARTRESSRQGPD